MEKERSSRMKMSCDDGWTQGKAMEAQWTSASPLEYFVRTRLQCWYQSSDVWR